MPDGNVPKPAKIAQAKGKPWIYWVGKRGIEEVTYFPAQETERFDPDKEIEKGGWSNLLFHGDNKEVMGHLLHKFRGQVDLVYIDPPFDSKADYVRKVELRSLARRQISGEEQSLLEQVQYSDLWANDEYLQFMYERLILLRELMSETGSIYLHCDWRQSHRLRCLMDEVFGAENFQNEIIWCYTRPSQVSDRFPRVHYTIYSYSKGPSIIFNANDILVPYNEETLARSGRGAGVASVMGITEGDSRLREGGKVPEDHWNIPIIQGNALEKVGYPTQKPEAIWKG